MYSCLKQTKKYVDNRYTPFNPHLSKYNYTNYNHLKKYAYFYKTLKIVLSYYINNFKKFKFIKHLINTLPITEYNINCNIMPYLIENNKIKNILWWRTDTHYTNLNCSFGTFSNNYNNNNFSTYKINMLVILLNKFKIFNENEKKYYYNNTHYILYELSQLKISHPNNIGQLTFLNTVIERCDENEEIVFYKLLHCFGCLDRNIEYLKILHS